MNCKMAQRSLRQTRLCRALDWSRWYPLLAWRRAPPPVMATWRCWRFAAVFLCRGATCRAKWVLPEAMRPLAAALGETTAYQHLVWAMQTLISCCDPPDTQVWGALLLFVVVVVLISNIGVVLPWSW